MLRAGGPAEGDDSKETNIAVALLTTDAMANRETRARMTIGTWKKAEDAENKGILGSHVMIKIPICHKQQNLHVYWC